MSIGATLCQGPLIIRIRFHTSGSFSVFFFVFFADACLNTATCSLPRTPCTQRVAVCCVVVITVAVVVTVAFVAGVVFVFGDSVTASFPFFLFRFLWFSFNNCLLILAGAGTTITACFFSSLRVAHTTIVLLSWTLAFLLLTFVVRCIC